MSTFNKVVNQSFFKTLTSGNQNLSVGWATQTDAWNRTQLSDTVKKEFEEAVKQAIQKGEIPATAGRVILTEKEHMSGCDTRDYYSGVIQDESGKHIKTHHFTRKK